MMMRINQPDFGLSVRTKFFFRNDWNAMNARKGKKKDKKKKYGKSKLIMMIIYLLLQIATGDGDGRSNSPMMDGWDGMG